MGTTSEKLTYLNETKSKIKDNINLTGAGLTNQTPFRQYATDLKTALLNILNNGIDTLYNNFPQTTGTGTNITLNNTLEAPIKSELLGNTSQNGTPTPDTPVEVINATGRQVVKVSNESQEQTYNINLGYNLFKTPYNESSKTKNGITFTINEDGSIHVEGTATAKTQFNLRTRDLLLDLNIGERYTIATSGLGVVDSTIWLDTYGQTGNFLGRWSLTSNTPYTSAVAEAKDNKPYISITVENGATINTDVKVWLYKGAYDSSIEYSPYKTPIELCKIGDYKDRIYYNNGKWYLEKNIGKVILDGSETGSSYQESSHRYYRTINDMYNYETQNRYYDLIINRFYPSATIQNQVGYCFHYQKSIYLYMPTTITTIEEANIWLSTHNTEIYYVLATPIVEEITDNSLINDLNNLEDAKSYNGTTNITITAETPADIKITALKNE